MKRYVKKLMLCCLFFVTVLLIFGISKASTLNIDYNNKEEIKSGDVKLYPGDEVFISFSLADDEDNENRVMAIYGNIEYDKDIFELVKPEENGKIVNPKVGEGWLAGNINENDNSFFFYTIDKKRSSIIGFLKFKVKAEVQKPTDTTFSTKDVTLYRKVNDSNYEEITSGGQDCQLQIKINSKKGEATIGLIIAIVLFIALIIFICYFVKKGFCNKKEQKVAKKEQNKEVKEQSNKKIEEPKSNNKAEKLSKEEETSKADVNLKEDIEAKIEKLTIAKEQLEKVKAESVESTEKESGKIEEIEKAEDKDKNKKQTASKGNGKKSTSTKKKK